MKEFLTILLGCYIGICLTACIHSPVNFNLSAYSRGGVIENESQTVATNSTDEVWTDSKGGGSAKLDIDPTLPALP